jgi:hypothetical protein
VNVGDRRRSDAAATAGLDGVHPHMPRAAFIMAALDADMPLRDVQLAARHGDPRSTIALGGSVPRASPTEGADRQIGRSGAPAPSPADLSG